MSEYLNNIFQGNIETNKKETLNRETLLFSKPRRLNVALTTKCNLACIMCESRKIDWEVPSKVINEIILLFPYLERVVWQGGEVFLFDSFKQILRAAERYPNLTHEITTNGHLITEDWLGLIKKINLDLNISIDGVSQQTYEHIRKGSKFQDILKFLGLLNGINDAGKTFVLIFTVMKSNFFEMDKIVAFAQKNNFNRVILQPVKGNYDNEENIFYRKDLAALRFIDQVKPRLKQEARDSGIELVEWLPACPSSDQGNKDGESIMPKEKINTGDSHGNLFCYAPWQQLFIEWGGNVYPHCLCLEDGPNETRKIGSVIKSSLLEIWNNERMRSFRQKIIDNNMQDICARDCINGLILESIRNLPIVPQWLGRVNNTEMSGIDMALCKGKQYIEQHKHDLAFKQFESIITAYPDSAEAHFELGKIHYLQGNYLSAIKELSETRRLNPPDSGSRLLLAKLYKTTGRYELAFEQLQPLLVNSLTDPEISKELKDIYPGYIQELKDYNNQGEFTKVSEKARRLYEIIPQEDVFYSNKALSELEISQRKLIVSAKMRNLIVTLSTACNLNCVMCEERRIKWDIPKNILEEIISNFAYLERVVWQGGEAFLVDYFDELIEEAAKFPHLRQVITTNGLFIDERRAEKLVKNNVDLTFSIDGLTKEIYEKVRRGADFELLMRNLSNFNQARKKYNNPLLNTNLHAVIMKSNYHQLEEYIDFAKEHEFKLLAFLPIGGNFDNPENIFYSQDEKALRFIARVIPGIEEKAKQYGVLLENRLPVKKPDVSAYDNTAPAVDKAGFNNRLFCHLPWIQLYIDYDGTIRPDCVCRPEKNIGHANKDSLAEVWNNEKMQQYRKIISDNRCSEICNLECVRGQVSQRYLKFS